MNGRIPAGDHRWLALGVTAASALAVALTGCAGGGGTAGTGSSAPAVSAAASSAPATGAASAAGSSSGAPDPCQVVTAGEASTLVGQTVKQNRDAMSTCTYLSDGGALVTVTVRQLPSSATSQAQAYYNKAVTQFSGKPGVVLTHPGIGDQSLAGTLTEGPFQMSAIAFLKGTVYVGILAKPGPDSAAMKSIAMTALGRV